MPVYARATPEPTFMNEKTIQILLVEDEQPHVELIRWAFEASSVDVNLTVAQTLEEAHVALADFTPDLVIIDLLLPDGKGTDLLPRARVGAGFPCIIMTSHGDEQAAVSAMKAGAFDYVVKSQVTLSDLPHTAQRVLREWRVLTERKKAEEELRRSQERYRYLFENIRNAAFLADSETGVIVDANLQAETLLGRTRDEIIGMHQSQLHPPENGDEYRTLFRDAIEGRVDSDVDAEIVRADGTTVPVNITGSLMTIHGRKLILGLFRDVTERKREEQVLATRLRYEKALASCSQALQMPGDPEEALELALKHLLKASGADRVGIFENFDDPLEGLCVRQILEVCAPGVTPQIDNEFLQHAPYKDGYSRWQETFARGEGIMGSVTSFPEEERKLLEAHDILSILVLPIWSGGKWYGVIGFDDTRAPREWSDEDVRLLRTATVMIGTFIGRRQAQREREATIELLKLANTERDYRELMRKLTASLRQWSGCEAVGIRLRDGNDYPYYETRGFPEEFVLAASSLCAKDSKGTPVLDDDGSPVLECMCGNVLSGRTDPTKPFFTQYGSFWTNSITGLLAATGESEHHSHARNRCHREGYESVALVPLRYGQETLGLFQFNDKRKGRFSSECVAVLERLAASTAIVLSHRDAEHQIEGLARFPSEDPDPVMRIDRDGTVLYANAAGMPLLAERNSGADQPAPDPWRQWAADAITTGTGSSVEVEHDGRVFSFMIVPVADAGYVNLYGRDITGRKQAEEELHEKIRQNRAFLDALPCVAMLLRPDREIVVSNRAAQNVRAVPGEQCYATFGKRGDPCPWCLAPVALATGEPQHIEVEGVGRIWDTHWVPVGPDLYLHYAFDITDQRRAEGKLLEYQKQLQSLASELSLAEERERRQVASVLHDRIGQTLAVSKMKLAAMREELSGSDYSAPVNEILDLIEQTIQDTRSLTLELSPPILYELGLEAALHWLAEEFQRRHGIACEFEDDGADKPLGDDIRVVLFQAVRELLVNVAKHARAGLVRMVVAREEDHITLSVQDDGIGFDTDETGSRPRKAGGFGLFNIRERLEHLGGRLDLHSQPGKGTGITLTAPVTPQHDQEHAL